MLLILAVLLCRDEGPPPKRRDRLPKPAQAEKSVSLWSILKEVVGKDLTRVCLPVYFNEPLSALQKIAEELEYSELVDKVCVCCLRYTTACNEQNGSIQ